MRNHLFVLALLSLPAVDWAQTPDHRNEVPQIVTTGEGEARLAPDRVTLFVGVQSRAATAAAAGAENSRRQRAVLDTLKSLGLAAEQLSTLNYSVSPDMQFNQTNGTSRIIGYTVTNTIRADIRRIDDVGRLIDATLSKGANEISGLQFFSSKADSARRVALASAVAQARGNAEALAKAAGGSLGPLLELSTAQTPIRPGAYEPRMAAAKIAGSTPIEPGEQTFSVSVTGRWSFLSR